VGGKAEETSPLPVGLAGQLYRLARLVDIESLAREFLDGPDELLELRDDIVPVFSALSLVAEGHVEDEMGHTPFAVIDIEPFHEQRAVVVVAYQQVRSRKPGGGRISPAIKRRADVDPGI